MYSAKKHSFLDFRWLFESSKNSVLRLLLIYTFIQPTTGERKRSSKQFLYPSSMYHFVPYVQQGREYSEFNLPNWISVYFRLIWMRGQTSKSYRGRLQNVRIMNTTPVWWLQMLLYVPLTNVQNSSASMHIPPRTAHHSLNIFDFGK